MEQISNNSSQYNPFTYLHINQTELSTSDNSHKIIQKCTSQLHLIRNNIFASKQKLDQKTTNHGAITGRSQHSDRTEINYLKQNKSNEQIKQNSFKSLLSKKYQNIDQQQQILKEAQTNNMKSIQKLKRFLITIHNFSLYLWKRILNHLSKVSTSDKYIRLVYSILKLYRAFNQKNSLQIISKQLLTARRIIQWQTKYQLIKQLKDQNLSAVETAYKIFQLFGNLFDFSAFWLSSLSSSVKFSEWGQIMYSWQDDCYFYQCIIELILSIKNSISYLINLLKQNHSQQKLLSIKHSIVTLRQSKQKLILKLDKLKKLDHKQNRHINILNKETDLNNKQYFSIENVILQSLQQKIEIKQKQMIKIKSCYEQCKQEQNKRCKKQMIKNMIKIIKYFCDSITSYNNYSYKVIDVNSKLGGILSTVSSLFSMYLIWNN